MKKQMLDTIIYWVGLLTLTSLAGFISAYAGYKLASYVVYPKSKSVSDLTSKCQLDKLLAQARAEPRVCTVCAPGFEEDLGITNQAISPWVTTSDKSKSDSEQVIKFMRENYDKIRLVKITDEMLVVPNLKVCYSKVNDVETTNFFAKNYHVYVSGNNTLKVGEVVLLFEGNQLCVGYTHRFSDKFRPQSRDEEQPKEYSVFKFDSNLTSLLLEFLNPEPMVFLC